MEDWEPVGVEVEKEGGWVVVVKVAEAMARVVVVMEAGELAEVVTVMARVVVVTAAGELAEGGEAVVVRGAGVLEMGVVEMEIY